MIRLSLASGSGVSLRLTDQGLDKFARQPYDALIFGLNARRRLQHEPRDVDDQAERENERQKHVEPGAQREFLPHGTRPCRRPRKFAAHKER